MMRSNRETMKAAIVRGATTAISFYVSERLAGRAPRRWRVAVDFVCFGVLYYLLRALLFSRLRLSQWR